MAWTNVAVATMSVAFQGLSGICRRPYSAGSFAPFWLVSASLMYALTPLTYALASLTICCPSVVFLPPIVIGSLWSEAKLLTWFCNSVSL